MKIRIISEEMIILVFCRLLRRQAPSPSASFFERMQFLIQEDGLQTSSIYSSFNERYLY